MKRLTLFTLLSVLVVSFSCNDQGNVVEPTTSGARRSGGDPGPVTQGIPSEVMEIASLDGLSDTYIDGTDRSGGIYEWDEGVFQDNGNSPASAIKPGKLHKKAS